ncbi:hypothetical protein L1987_49643 [Smallanthus sonchifolius]|uniref:Uncharacterized protein n=1 Tax=Smallanthus sonchifolius TaxID=185202 RepID=A0ACB9FW53_9ASTR|nr:hypothetical protein L1987_49643 [Smallanthus sonchifolius]
MMKKSINQDAGNCDRKRNIPQRKPETYRKLSDIYEDPESDLRARCQITTPVNVNRRFVPVIEDESDDDNVTLAEYFRKQKGVEITDSTLKKKKKIIEVEYPRVDQIKKSKQRSKDSMAQQKKDFHSQCNNKFNRFAEVSYTEATENENEDLEMEAVMLLASHFNEDEQTLSELKTNTTYVCVESGNKSITNTSSKSVATKNPVVYDDTHMKIARVLQDEHNFGTVVCCFNRNPAEFSLPDAESEFMREGTASNEDYILPFKTGSFLPYKRFSPAWDTISGTLLHISAEDEAFIAFNCEIDANSFQNERKGSKLSENGQDLNQRESMLMAGNRLAIMALQEQYGTGDIVQQGVESLVTPLSRIYDTLQIAYEGLNLDQATNMLFSLSGFYHALNYFEQCISNPF